MKRSEIGFIVSFALLAILATSGASGNASAKSAVVVSPPTNGTSGKLATSASANRPEVAQAPAWHNPYPDYNAIKMVSATSGWIVGQGGDIKHLYNGGWGDYPSPVTNTLYAVDVNGSDGWAVGANNTILQLVGTDWQVVASPAPLTTTLVDVKVAAPGEAWALGDNQYYHDAPSVILHYSGGAWSVVSTPVVPSSISLNQMSCGSATDCWVAGHSNSAYHYSSGNWSAVTLPFTNTSIYPISIYMLNANEGWMGLYDGGGGSNSTILHYSGGQWQFASLDSASRSRQLAADEPAGGCGSYTRVSGVISFVSSDYYSTGDQGCMPLTQTPFFNHNGAQIGSPDNFVNGLSGVAANDIWVVGAGGSIYHWNGTNLTTTVSAPAYSNHIQMLSASDGWLGGGPYSVYPDTIYHYDGNIWSATPITEVRAFAFDSANDGWAVQESYYQQASFLYYNGSSFTATQSFSATRINAMQMLTSTSGWAAGDYFNSSDYQPLVAHYNGTAWLTTTIGGSITGTLSALSFTSPNDGWAVGNDDDYNFGHIATLVYQYSGGAWVQATLPVTDLEASAVYATQPNDVWVSGMSNNNYSSGQTEMLHWNGSSWTVTLLPVQKVTSIQMFSASEGWASSYGGPYLHYSGGSWQVVANPVGYSGYMLDLSFDSPTDGWSVGITGPQHYYPECLDYYTDVPAGNFAAQAVFYLSCHGIISGTGNHKFSPNANATRIQFAKMISLARGWPLVTPTTATFSDVPPTNPLYIFVETAYANGAISGATPATCTARGLASPCFLPNDNISRAQTAVITVRAFGWPINTTGGPHFTDVPTSNFAYGAIETCYHHGVVNGIGGGLFAPNTNVTRAQLAVILYKGLAQL